MKVSSCYPVLMTDRVEETARFYETTFGFVPTFVSDWYVSLAAESDGGRFELAILRRDHETIPAGFRNPCRGVLVNLEVEDARAEWDRLTANSSVRVVKPIVDEEFGQRHFIIVDPADNLVDVIENIPPSAAFAERYLDG